jgi:hypothetical protein
MAQRRLKTELVASGRAPDALLATKTGVGGATLWQRPICAYPKAAKYSGIGDPANPASFHCERP